MGLINNGIETIYKHTVERYELDKYFDVLVNSSREKCKKPQAEIYRIACKRLGVEPGGCLFVDDNKENIAGAEKLGMKTIHFESSENTIDRIKK